MRSTLLKQQHLMLRSARSARLEAWLQRARQPAGGHGVAGAAIACLWLRKLRLRSAGLAEGERRIQFAGGRHGNRSRRREEQLTRLKGRYGQWRAAACNVS